MKLLFFSMSKDDRPSISVLYCGGMRRKMSNRFKCIISLFLLSLIGLSPLTADDGWDVAWAPGVSLSTSYYGAIPVSDSLKEQESLPMRSQLAIQLDLEPLAVRFGRLTLNGELWVRYTSRSMYWGDTFYRPFWAIGPAVSIHIQCNDLFGIQFGGAALYCFNTTVHQAFAAIDAEVAPTIRFQAVDHNWLTIMVPVRLQFRNDILGLQVGIGIKWNYDTTSTSSADRKGV